MQDSKRDTDVKNSLLDSVEEGKELKSLLMKVKEESEKAYTPRKPELKETHVPQCSSQDCLQ